MNLPSRGASSEAWYGAASFVGPDELLALYEASATLSRSLDLRHTQETIVLAARHRFGFDRAGLWLCDPERDGMQGSAGTSASLQLIREDHQFIPYDQIPAPIRLVLAGELPFYLTSNLQDDLPASANVESMEGVHANLVVPLRRGDEVLGFLSVDNQATNRTIGEAQARLLLLFANYAAAALQNALIAEQTRSHLAEVELRRRLERKLRRLGQIHEVASEIVSLDLDAVLRLLRDRIVEVFQFDRAGTLLFEPSQPEILRGTWGTDNESQARDERTYRFMLAEWPALAEVVRGDRPFLLQHLDPEDPGAPNEPEIAQHVLVPLRSHEGFLGVLSVDNTLTGRPITEEEIEPLLLLAGHAALAVQKARVYSLEQEVSARLRRVLGQERRMARTLQKAFKPEVDREMRGVRIAHLYRPAIIESELGGDFYDVLDLEDGRIGLVMADVSGKGLPAAARTLRARFALQAYAFEDPDPASVMARLNRFLYCRGNLSGEFVTVFYGVLDPLSGTLDAVSAGHEPPLWIPATGPPQVVQMSGMPCGLFPEYNCETRRWVLGPGDRLLLYSDGITEARRGKELFDTRGLVDVLTRPPRRAIDPTVRDLYAQVLRFTEGQIRDDVALLMIERQMGSDPLKTGSADAVFGQTAPVLPAR